jgi:hypothetical protein
MKNRLYILLLNTLLLIAVCYVQVLQKFMVDHPFSIEFVHDVNDDAEENTQKTSEENSRETDLDEDPFSINEAMIISSGQFRVSSKSVNYSFGQPGYYPEIVSPPPQA